MHVTEANVMILPGRVPGYKSSDIQLLPSSTTKRQVWELYQQAASVESMCPVSYSTFTSLWRQLLPHVVVMKPMSDLCWMCQKNSTAITRSANRPEREKTLVCKSMRTQYIHVTLGVTKCIHKNEELWTCEYIYVHETERIEYMYIDRCALISKHTIPFRLFNKLSFIW